MDLNPAGAETQVLTEWTLGDALGLLAKGTFLRPNFQRDFVWDEELINELIRSIFRGYHTGSLLLWSGNDENSGQLSLKPLYGLETAGDEPHAKSPMSAEDKVIVLDGQQRLTAMHYAFFAPDVGVPDGRMGGVPVRFYLNLDAFSVNRRQDHTAIGGISTTQATSSGEFVYESHPAPAHDSVAEQNEQFERHRLPLGLLGGGSDAYVPWKDGYVKFWEGRRAHLASEVDALAVEYDQTNASEDLAAWELKQNELDAIDRYIETGQGLSKFLDKVLDYKVKHILLPGNESPDRVKDTFLQVNRRGKQLTTFELFSAEASWNGMSPRVMVEEADSALNKLGIDVSRERLQYLIPQLMLLRRHPEFVDDSGFSMQHFETFFGRFFLPLRDDDTVGVFESREDFQGAWKTAFEELRDALLALRDNPMFGAVHKGKYEGFVLFDGLLPPFAAIWADAHNDGADVYEPLAEKKIRQWYWSRVFGGDRYENAPSDDDWRERDANARKMVRDYKDVMAWLRRDDNEPRKRPYVVLDTERQIGPSPERRSAHVPDENSSVAASAAAQANTNAPLYYAVLNCLNMLKPQGLRAGAEVTDAAEPVRVSRLFGSDWANAKERVPESDLGSPFNQLLTDSNGDKLVRLGVVPASYFRELESEWLKNGGGGVFERYIAMLESHCISADMYGAIGPDTKAWGRRRLHRVDRQSGIERKLTDWEAPNPKRTNQEEKDLDISVQTFRQFLVDREQRLLHEFGWLVFDTDLSIGLADRELLSRVLAVEAGVRMAIARFLATLDSGEFASRIIRVKQGRAPDREEGSARQAVERALKRGTPDAIEQSLQDSKWGLWESRWFAQFFYAELASSEGWPKDSARKTFGQNLDNLRQYRNKLAHDASPVTVPQDVRNLGRAALDQLEQVWHLRS